MAKLYELTQCYKNLLDLIDNPEIPADIISNSLNEVEEDMNTKLENVAKVIKSIEVDAKGLKEEEKRLADRRKSLENRIINLKEYAESSMKAVGLTKIKGKVFTLGIQKNAPSIEIETENDIPTKYFIPQEPKLDRKTLLKDMKEGIEIPGVSVKQTECLRIR